MTEQLVKIESIKDNPYQGRQVYDDIDQLGRSIATDGLQEKPKARVSGKGYQLKFGHRRREAFRWLAANWKAQNLPDRYDGYTVMPLDIEELTDEEMYRGAVIENEQRKNLNAIEQAEMMLVYKDQFKKSSDEIGQLFGMSGATVRGLVRLLDLPTAVKDKVASGEITQGAARSLLTIARVDEKQVAKAAEAIAAGTSAEDVIMQSMRDSDTTLAMWQSWNDGKPRGGDGLWFLEMKPDKFPMKHLPELRAADVAKALGMEPTADLCQKIRDRYLVTVNDAEKAAALTEMHPEDANLIERIAHLANPPACAACAFHASADRAHYCGFKACHQRKRAAWVAAEMQKISKALSIAVYNPVVDGKAFLLLSESTYEKGFEARAKLVADHDADLRIAPHKNEYSKHKWTESNFCRVILVGSKAKVIKEKKRDEGSSEQAKQEAYRKQRELEEAHRNASRKFTADYAVKQFAVVFKGIDHIPAMCALTNSGTPRKTAKKAEVLTDLRVQLARRALDNLNGYDWRLLEKGPIACAKYLQGVATAWEVKLPADFMDVAKGYQPAVSVETEKKGKVKE